jgi:DNA-binding NtrC family response regulator
MRGLENVVERATYCRAPPSPSPEILAAKAPPACRKGTDTFDEMNLVETEKRLIIKALDAASWNQSKAAEVLGISRKQLRTKMKNFRLLQQ